MRTFIIERQNLEALTDWQPFPHDDLTLELSERLCWHRGEVSERREPHGYLAHSENVFKWILAVIRDGRQVATLSYPISESLLIGKSNEEVHEHMRASFAERVRVDLCGI